MDLCATEWEHPWKDPWHGLRHPRNLACRQQHRVDIGHISSGTKTQEIRKIYTNTVNQSSFL
jgi:hypothetical protein